MFVALLAQVLITGSISTPIFSESIEVKVGSHIISTLDVDLMVETLEAEAKQNPQSKIAKTDKATLRKQALELLIDQSLRALYLENMNFPITDRDVDQRINAIRASNGVQSLQDFQNLLQSKGISFEKYRAQVKQQMERAQFMGLVRRQALRTIPDEDLMSYYKNHPEIYKDNWEVVLQECQIRYDQEPRADDKAKYFVNKPSEFPVCIKTLHHGPSLGGNLGSFQKGVLPENIEAEVFKKDKNGNVTAGRVILVPNQQGYQLLFVKDAKKLGSMPFEQVKDRIREILEAQYLEIESQKILSGLRSDFISSKKPS